MMTEIMVKISTVKKKVEINFRIIYRSRSFSMDSDFSFHKIQRFGIYYALSPGILIKVFPNRFFAGKRSPTGLGS